MYVNKYSFFLRKKPVIMEDTELVKKLLVSLEDQVGVITDDIKEKLLKEPLKDSLELIHKIGERDNNQAKSELEEAKLVNLVSYLLVSLYFTSLKVNGSKLNNESVIMNEIKRVKGYMDRVKKAEENLNKKEINDQNQEEKAKELLKKQLKYQPAVSHVHFKDEEEDFKKAEKSKPEKSTLQMNDIKKIAQAKKQQKKSNDSNKSSKPSSHKNDKGGKKDKSSRIGKINKK